MQKKILGILTGGGDCPGLNPAIKAATKKALENNFDVLGIREGWHGLINNELNPIILDRDLVRHIDRDGGTILGTSRTNPFKINDGEKLVKKRIEKLKLDALIAIGGEDTLGVASRLYNEQSIKVVGIPKTIDRDLSHTDYTLGFESALQVITDSVDSLRSTAESHSRIFVVEVMGRHAGHLALRGGISSQASIVLIPEHKFSLDRVCEILIERKIMGIRYSIVMVAEGATLVDKKEIKPISTKLDAFGHARLGGIASFLAEAIEEKTKLECRFVVLSHLQRGGKPVAYDRRLGFYFGVAATEAVLNNNFGQMVALKKGRIVLVPISLAVSKLSTVDISKYYDKQNYKPSKNVLGVL